MHWQLQAVIKQSLMFLMMLTCYVGVGNVGNEPRQLQLMMS